MHSFPVILMSFKNAHPGGRNLTVSRWYTATYHSELKHVSAVQLTKRHDILENSPNNNIMRKNLVWDTHFQSVYHTLTLPKLLSWQYQSFFFRKRRLYTFHRLFITRWTRSEHHSECWRCLLLEAHTYPTFHARFALFTVLYILTSIRNWNYTDATVY